MDKRIDVSIVIPVLNEEGNVKPLYSSIKDVMDGLDKEYEIIFVDDGSTDRTLSILEDIQRQDENIVVLSFRKNFGQTAAMAAGFDYSRGDVIVTMDGDLQNDPVDIPKFLEKIKEYDVVSGWRVKRKDPFFTKRLPSKVANRLISCVTGVKLHDYGCTLKAYRKDVIKSINLYGEMHRFIPAIASWIGVSVAEIEVSHRPRRSGRSKYGLFRTIKVLLDLITIKFLQSFSTKPIHLFGLAGLLSGGVGFVISFYLSIEKLIYGHDIGGRPLLLLGIFLMIVGLQLIIMGLLAEMLVRIYHEAQEKPIYILKKVLKK
ncbi:MAG: glycosyltransferase family 2 protein [Thermodesulfobacteriota bacterium]